jgi:hypothetical protein
MIIGLISMPVTSLTPMRRWDSTSRHATDADHGTCLQVRNGIGEVGHVIAQEAQTLEAVQQFFGFVDSFLIGSAFNPRPRPATAENGRTAATPQGGGTHQRAAPTGTGRTDRSR